MALRALLLLAAVSIATGALQAQQPARNHSLSIDVKPVSSGGATRTRNAGNTQQVIPPPGMRQGPFQDQNIATTRARTSGIGLDVEVRNLARTGDVATVEWYFFGKSVNGSAQFIFDHGTREVTLPPARSEIVAIDSKALTNSVEKRLTLRSGNVDGAMATGSAASATRRGSKVAGWIVRLVAEGRVLQVKASSPSLEALGRNSAQLDATSRTSGF